jgi:hypothetical protein
MAQRPGGSHATRQRAGNDIYTVLAILAFVAVAGTLGFVIYRCNELLGTPFPSFPG